MAMGSHAKGTWPPQVYFSQEKVTPSVLLHGWLLTELRAVTLMQWILEEASNTFYERPNRQEPAEEDVSFTSFDKN